MFSNCVFLYFCSRAGLSSGQNLGESVLCCVVLCYVNGVSITVALIFFFKKKVFIDYIVKTLQQLQVNEAKIFTDIKNSISFFTLFFSPLFFIFKVMQLS